MQDLGGKKECHFASIEEAVASEAKQCGPAEIGEKGGLRQYKEALP